jgi:hypothetical protein
VSRNIHKEDMFSSKKTTLTTSTTINAKKMIFLEKHFAKVYLKVFKSFSSSFVFDRIFLLTFSYFFSLEKSVAKMGEKVLLLIGDLGSRVFIIFYNIQVT